MTASTSTIAVRLNNDNPQRSQQLSERLGLPLVEACDEHAYPYVLISSDKGLAIQQTGPKAAGPVCVDFEAGTTDHRRKQGGGELIVKAVAGDKTQRPTVLDATAGLGRDSFVLASHHYPVILCERSPVVAAVLEDGLNRAAAADNEDLQQIVQRMALKKQDAMSYLQTEGIAAPDVIVIDPMFPASKKSALVKKDMRAFHQIVGADEDSGELLVQALATARHRVVVKRPKKAEFLAAKKPNFSVEGKAIRFDIYSLKAYGK